MQAQSLNIELRNDFLLLTRMVGNAISNQAYSFHLIYSKWIIWLREYNTWQYVESQMRDNKCVE